MAGRKSVKRGGKKRSMRKRSMRKRSMQKSRKGLRKRIMRKRSGKKTYKRYIKKGGVNKLGPERYKLWNNDDPSGLDVENAEEDIVPPMSLTDEDRKEIIEAMINKLEIISIGNETEKPVLSSNAKGYITKLKNDINVAVTNSDLIDIEDFIQVHLHNEDSRAFAKRKANQLRWSQHNTK